MGRGGKLNKPVGRGRSSFSGGAGSGCEVGLLWRSIRQSCFISTALGCAFVLAVTTLVARHFRPAAEPEEQRTGSEWWLDHPLTVHCPTICTPDGVSNHNAHNIHNERVWAEAADAYERAEMILPKTERHARANFLACRANCLTSLGSESTGVLRPLVPSVSRASPQPLIARATSHRRDRTGSAGGHGCYGA